MSTFKVDVLQSRSGGATTFTGQWAAKAWVSFDGTAVTVTPRASGNITGLTDNGTGDYNLNFTSAFADANYAPAGCAGNSSTNTSVVTQPYNLAAPTSSTVRIQTGWTNGGTNDMATVNVSIIR